MNVSDKWYLESKLIVVLILLDDGEQVDLRFACVCLYIVYIVYVYSAVARLEMFCEPCPQRHVETMHDEHTLQPYRCTPAESGSVADSHMQTKTACNFDLRLFF
jgi:hypothetical protein